MKDWERLKKRKEQMNDYRRRQMEQERQRQRQIHIKQRSEAQKLQREKDALRYVPNLWLMLIVKILFLPSQ